MLNERFLRQLRAEFPSFYERVNEEAMRNASRLRAETGGDVQRALMRTRVEGAGQLWWPYIKGSVPFFGNDRPAMEAFTRLVLTVDHIVGYQPQDADTAADQVVSVLEETFDPRRLAEMLKSDKKEDAAVGTVGLLASATALVSPFRDLARARKIMRFVPIPVRITIGVAIGITLLSIPLMAGYSAGTQAERAARNFGELPHSAKKSIKQ